MACKACERRRKRMRELRDKKAAKGKKVQAAVIDAALKVSEAAGKAIHGEVEDGQERTQSEDPETGGSTG